MQVERVGWCARSVVWCCCSKDREFLFPLIWFQDWESSGLPLHFFQILYFVAWWLLTMRKWLQKIRQRLLVWNLSSFSNKGEPMTISYYTFLFHRITLNVVTVPNELFCPHSRWSQVHTQPAFHTMRESSLCCFSSSQLPSEVKLYSAVPHLNFFLYSLDLTVSMLSQEKFSTSGFLLAA